MNGGLEQICTLVTDPTLAKCIEALGDNSDNPTEPQLLEVTPALIEETIGANLERTVAAYPEREALV